MWLRRILQQTYRALEDETIPLNNYIAIFLGCLVLRFLAEGYTQSFNYLNVPSAVYALSFLHVTSFYIAVALGVLMVFSAAFYQEKARLMRFILAGFVILFWAPCVDFITHPIHGVQSSYIHPNANNIFYIYFSLLGGYSGLTVGLRSEILMAIAAFYGYARYKGASVFKALCIAWLCYSLIFILGATPYLLAQLASWLQFPYQFNNFIMIAIFSAYSLCFALVILLNHCIMFNNPRI